MAKAKKNLQVVTGEQLPSCDVGFDMFDKMTKSTEFLPRIQLYTKGRMIDKAIIGAGHYGVPNGEEVQDLGDEIDILPLVWRPKALDTSDRDAIVEKYDLNDPEFERIQAAALGKDSGCMFGPTFLVYERVTGEFYELFCGNASGRISAKSIIPYLPLTDAAATEQTQRTGKVVEAHGPLTCTLSTKYAQKKTYGWHVIVVHQCSTPFESVPAMEVIAEECRRFLAREGSKIEKVEDVAGGRAR